MYSIEILPKAIKDLADISSNYRKLIARYINNLSENLTQNQLHYIFRVLFRKL
jgi:mRNA-degrading endonuclease RelE of RelBE toxin-antitoxin system